MTAIKATPAATAVIIVIDSMQRVYVVSVKTAKVASQ